MGVPGGQRSSTPQREIHEEGKGKREKTVTGARARGAAPTVFYTNNSLITLDCGANEKSAARENSSPGLAQVRTLT